MKKPIILLSFAALGLSSCSVIDNTLCTLERNRQAVEISTQSILENADAIDAATCSIEENRRQIEEINKSLQEANKG